jgi:hypothetical protein
MKGGDEPTYSLGSVYAGQYCSLSRISTLPEEDNWIHPAAVGSENKGGFLAALWFACRLLGEYSLNLR